MRALFVLLLSFFVGGCSSLSRPDIEFRSGYGTTTLKDQGPTDIIVTRISAQCPQSFIPPQFGRLSPKIELVADTYVAPDLGYLLGVTPLLKYSYPFTFNFSAFLEAGAGPVYLSLETFEQGDPGFNFIDQIGGGVEYNLGGLQFTLGYRFSHVSHAGLRNNRNRGIDTHAVLLGIRF